MRHSVGNTQPVMAGSRADYVGRPIARRRYMGGGGPMLKRPPYSGDGG